MIKGIFRHTAHFLDGFIKSFLNIDNRFGGLFQFASYIAHKLRAFKQLVFHFRHGAADFLAD